MKNLFLLFLILFSISCKRAADKTDENMSDTDTLTVTTPGDNDMRDTVDVNSPEKNAYAEFTVSSGPTAVRLRDWKRNMNLPALGAANDTLVRELTIGSDTHKGSTVTEYKYDDINLAFYTPKGSADSWLMNVEIKGGPWATARGIKVGDSVADMKAMYPSATNNDPDKTLYRYVVDESLLTFGTDGNKVTGIKVEYNIP